MRPFVSVRELPVEASAEAVFELLSDWTRMADWLEGIDRIELKDGDALAPGVGFFLLGREVGFDIQFDCRVVVMDAPKTLVYTVEDTKQSHTMTWTLTPEGPRRCRVEGRMVTTKVVGNALYRRLVKTLCGVQVSRQVARLKKMVES